MARRNTSLKPQLNQIRTWVAEGVTDIWIAHQLESTPALIASFRRQQGLLRPDETPAPAAASRTRAPRAAAEKKPAAAKATPAAAEKKPAAAAATADAAEATDDGLDDAPTKRRRRGRRGGRGRGRSTSEVIVPATLEHAADGVTIRIDASVLELADYREHWSEVTGGTITVTATGIRLDLLPVADAEDQSESDAS